jgi:hypothetical protein
MYEPSRHIIDSIGEKYLNILLEKGYEPAKRVLAIDNLENGTEYCLEDFKITKDKEGRTYYFYKQVHLLKQDFEEELENNFTRKRYGLRPIYKNSEFDLDLIPQYRKRYYDIVDRFDSIVETSVETLPYETDTNREVDVETLIRDSTKNGQRTRIYFDSTSINEYKFLFAIDYRKKSIFTHYERFWNLLDQNKYNYKEKWGGYLNYQEIPHIIAKEFERWNFFNKNNFITYKDNKRNYFTVTWASQEFVDRLEVNPDYRFKQTDNVKKYGRFSWTR